MGEDGEEGIPLSSFVRDYTGIDKPEYTPEEYNETFCNSIFGGIRSVNEAFFKVNGSNPDDHLNEKLGVEWERLFFRMDCSLYDMEGHDLEMWPQEMDVYLLHLHFQYTDDPVVGSHFDFEHDYNFDYE